MTEDELMESFSQATRLHANEGYAAGLHPIRVSEVLLLAAIEIAVQFEGIEAVRAGLYRAGANLGADHIQ